MDVGSKMIVVIQILSNVALLYTILVYNVSDVKK